MSAIKMLIYFQLFFMLVCDAQSGLDCIFGCFRPKQTPSRNHVVNPNYNLQNEHQINHPRHLTYTDNTVTFEEGDHSETVYETKESRARRKQYNQRQSNQFQHQESMNDSGPVYS